MQPNTIGCKDCPYQSGCTPANPGPPCGGTAKA